MKYLLLVVAILSLVVVNHFTPSYGSITPGEVVERYGTQCQVFRHSEGPDQFICFQSDEPFTVLGYKLWDRTVPAFFFEEGKCTSLYAECPSN